VSPRVPNATLNAISCPTPTSCVAVGSEIPKAGNSTVLIEAFSRGRWLRMAYPRKIGVLAGVSCPTLDRCIAVGYALPQNGPEAMVIMRWAAGMWQAISAPRGIGSGSASLGGVSCASPIWCMAAGRSKSGGLVLHLDGTHWVPEKVEVGGMLSGVSCTSSTFCMAIGTTSRGRLFVARWNGSAWHGGPIDSLAGGGRTDGILQGVSCTSLTFCSAVGYLGKDNRIEMWNGGDWQIVSSPSIPRARWPALFGVTCRSTSSCVAVGTSSNGVAISYPTLQTWNGHKWSLARLPSTRSAGALFGVACGSADSCFATGGQSDPPLIVASG